MKKLVSIPVIVNAVLFQALWFACVIGGAYRLIWPSLLALVALLAWQLQARNRHPSDVRLIVAALVMGLLFDSAWSIFGLLEFAGPHASHPWAPVWILVMWVGFALTINHSLAWLNSHPLLPAITGLIGGPMAYFAGLKLGAVDYLHELWLVSAILAVAWAISVTILVKISQTKRPAQPAST